MAVSKVKVGRLKRVFLLNVNRLRRHYYPYLRRKTPLFSHINIQTTSYCTRRCSFCALGDPARARIKHKMDEGLFRKIIDDLEGLDYSGRVSLFEINEPLSDERICAFVGYVKKKLPKAFQFLNTNGDLLTLELLDGLFTNGLDHLIMSCYDDRVLQKSKELVARRRYYCTVQDKGKDQFFFHDNRGGHVKGLFMLRPVVNMFCERVYKQLYIKPDGKVVSCVADHDDVNYMGNVGDSSVKDIWFSEKFEEIREKLRRGDRAFSPLCVNCNYAGEGGIYRVPKLRRLLKRIGCQSR
ncbi:MAG TPA: hypothetical protein DDW94_10610 [Deltaproteobacteria bacterium]|nr:hypothetical protein [Deltaproteobacteria bacterium]HCY11436.1 hypothetical protein [Deltaproteobacteria bacterium]